ncbi:Hypothetical protein, putative [Bodo saltans]|uniref:Uncharacterized protein n=1 Tax=Bodo saltans TaxID=75058 RepID=A0A0S4JM07_BODSA|nr:Hypothetical protein, putative [Bodo saltans]|eukprot:CUG92556.1 Hypothetical protein, putative [Bodo saltans]
MFVTLMSATSFVEQYTNNVFLMHCGRDTAHFLNMIGAGFAARGPLNWRSTLKPTLFMEATVVQLALLSESASVIHPHGKYFHEVMPLLFDQVFDHQ